MKKIDEIIQINVITYFALLDPYLSRTGIRFLKKPSKNFVFF